MANHGPNLYRIPQRPGYLGGYDWRATVFGLLLLGAVNWAATQYVAAQFWYQPALGTPLFRNERFTIYQPFAWILWGWSHSTSRDERIRQPLFIGEMIVFGGSVLSVVIFFAMTSRRSRQLSRNADDLHGSARWANEMDVERTGLLGADRGVYVGGWNPKGTSRLKYIRHDGPEHVLAFAPTRSGKASAS